MATKITKKIKLKIKKSETNNGAKKILKNYKKTERNTA